MDENFVAIDFETFSRHDIKYGSFRYAQDESTEVICMAYSINRGEPKLWYPGMPDPTDFIEYIQNGGLIRSFNATFEYAILNYTCTRLYNWPTVQVSQMRDTMSDVLALSLPGSLASCAEALGLEEQKDKRGKRLITLLSKPRKPTKNKPYDRITKDIEPELFQEFYDYCLQDVRTELSILDAIPRHIKGKEQQLFELTLTMNERGIPVDLELVQAILVKRKEYEARLNLEILNLTNKELGSTGSRPKSLKWLLDNGLALAGYTKADIKSALKKSNLKPEVRRFLEIRSELSRTPIKKYDFIEKAICKDGTLKNNVIFHKATTGRFAGAGFQIQNLPRDSSKDPEKLVSEFLDPNGLRDANIYEEAIKLIRSSLCAKENDKLVVSDFSSIENRVIAWLAEDEATIQDFIEGKDQYKTAASGIYGVDYEDVQKDQRQLGKVAVLACCFGGGHKTFKEVCAVQWGITITEEESKDIVTGYRAKYKKIVQLWYGLYDAALSCVTSGGITSYKKIKFRMMGDFLYMRLPSGRLIAYYKPEARMVTTPWGQQKLAVTHMGQNTYTRKWERLTIIPGRLTENVVQATARDFLTDAMLRIEEGGYPVIGCVHDEVISNVKDSFGSIDEFNELMEIVPEWGIGCPIDAEGYEDKRYRK